MPRYQIEDGQTGRTLLIEGDSPPSQEEAAELFGVKIDPDEFGVGEEVRGFGRALNRGGQRFLQGIQERRLREPSQLEDELQGLQQRVSMAEKAGGGTRNLPELKRRINELQKLIPAAQKAVPGAAQEFSKRQEAIEKLPPTEAQVEFSREETPWWHFFKNPVELASVTLAESAPVMAGSMLAAPTGPVGVAAVTGAGSFGAESSGRVINAMTEAGVDLKEPSQVIAWFADRAKSDRELAKADLAALGPAVFDALTAGFAGRFLGPALGKGVAPVAKATGKEVGMQMLGGGLGSIAGSELVGEPIDWKDVVLEVAGEFAPGEAISNVRAEGRRLRQAAATPPPVARPPAAPIEPQDQPIQLEPSETELDYGVGGEMPATPATWAQPPPKETPLPPPKEKQPPPPKRERVTVPGTPAEEYETVVAEIRRRKAITIRQIQELFPNAQIKRERARELLHLAWGKPAQPSREPGTAPADQATVSPLGEQPPVPPVTIADDAAAETDPNPTDDQIEAGNYKKGRFTIDGLNISIETAKGETRRSKPGQPKWEVTMPAHYGHILGTKAKDGDQVDVTVGPNPSSDKVFVIDQIDPKTGNYDEAKTFIGYDSWKSAVADYDASFSDGSGPSRRGGVSIMTKDQFKNWLKEGDTTKPLRYNKSKPKGPGDAIPIEGATTIPPGEPPEDSGPVEPGIPVKKPPGTGPQKGPEDAKPPVKAGDEAGMSDQELSDLMDEASAEVESEKPPPTESAPKPAPAAATPATTTREPITTEGILAIVRQAASENEGVFEQHSAKLVPSGVGTDAHYGLIGYNVEGLEKFAKFNAAHGGDGMGHIRLSIDEELAHLRDIIATRENGQKSRERYTAHHIELFRTVPGEVKAAIIALYKDVEDYHQMAELLRMKDQLSRLGKTTESTLGGFEETGQQRHVDVIKNWTPSPEIQSHLDKMAATKANSDAATRAPASAPAPLPPPNVFPKAAWELTREEFRTHEQRGTWADFTDPELSVAREIERKAYAAIKAAEEARRKLGQMESIFKVMDDRDGALKRNQQRRDADRAISEARSEFKQASSITADMSTHEGFVKRAIARGAKIPAAVLNEYPHLQPAAAPAPGPAPGPTPKVRTAAEIAAEAAKQGVEGVGEAIKGLHDLFGGGTHVGAGLPTFDEQSYAKAKPHFQASYDKFKAAGKTVKEFFKFIFEQFGAEIRPYLMRFMQDLKAATPDAQAILKIGEALASGPVSRSQVNDIISQTHGGTLASGAMDAKHLTDLVEAAINIAIRKMMVVGLPEGQGVAVAQVKRLKELLDRSPTQTTRTDEQIKMQQFSTPPPLAYVANWVANITKGDIMLEPSAGIGGLAVFANIAGARVIANELSPRRAALLRLLGIAENVTELNAEMLHALYEPMIASGQIPRPTVVVMNPPFSNAAETEQSNTLVGAKHVEQALSLLPEGGRLVAIVGQGMAADRAMFRPWWTQMYKRYNVRANIGVSGKEYRKYGTSFGNNILVIDKTGPTPDGGVVTGNVEFVEELVPLLERIRNDRPRAKSVPTEPSGPPTPQPPGGGPRPAPAPPAGPRGGGGGGGGRGGNAGKPGVRGPTQPGGSGPKTGGGTGAGGSDQPAAPGTGGTGETSPQPQPPSLDVQHKGEEIPIELVGEDGLFAIYKPAKVNIPGMQKHPTELVESASMASVPPVDPTYQPVIAESIVRNGDLSEAQLEQIVYAGQSHSQLLPNGERQGHFIGDGTGTGKGRCVAGVTLDNWNQGRRQMLWISKNEGLITESSRDLAALGLDVTKVINLAKKGAKKLAIPKGTEGFAFMTYNGLARDNPGLTPEGNLRPTQEANRMQVLLDWLGKDFDGVIAFDEVHLAGNAVSIRGAFGMKHPSQRALAVVDLQKLFPKARILYVSATGATDITNLSYGDRLGIWGPGKPFATKRDFFEKISAGGLSAMEMVAMNLKAMGVYLARTLSFRGVDRETIAHELTPEQIAMYNELAEAWQMIIRNVDNAMAGSGQNNNGTARGKAMGQMWGAQQRFFNQLLTAMQLPSVIADMKKKLAEGHSCVLQCVNTNESTLDRELAEQDDENPDLEDLDLSPKDMMLTYVATSFPTAHYHPVTDQNGNIRWVPTVDAEGNTVHDPEAIRARDETLARLSLIKAPQNPLEQILDIFGVDNVAEVTGRTKRVVWVTNKQGEREKVVESRSEAKRKVEANEFNAGKRRILIFTDAGGTGYSYHAGVKFKNQQRRAHYLLQGGWRADGAMQGMGRTHRADQVQPPVYILVSTNLKGHQRFISTIARRLNQLGALTGGERKGSGGGVYTEEQNIENAYSADAVRSLFLKAYDDRLPGFDFQQLARDLGFVRTRRNDRTGEMETEITLIDPTTGALISSRIPNVPKFLNRILTLPVVQQNLLFEHFMQILHQKVTIAKQTGRFDPGTQERRALEIRVIRDEVAHTHTSGAVTRLVDVEVDEAVDRWTFERVGKVEHWVQNVRSGRVYGLVKGPDLTDERSGGIVPTWYRIGVKGGHRIARKSDVTFDSPVPGANNHNLLTESAAKRLWDSEFATTPDRQTLNETYIVGAFLPVWDRIGISSPRIFRLKTDKGSFLGAQVPEPLIAQVRTRLGAGAAGQPTAQSVFRGLNGGRRYELANGWALKRSKVLEEWRIEAIGVEYSQRAEWKDFIGGYTELIQWNERFFLPNNEAKAIASLEKILAKSPIVPGNQGGTHGEAPRFSSFDEALRRMPKLLFGSLDYSYHKTLADLHYLAQHELDLWQEGEESDIHNDRDAQQVKKWMEAVARSIHSANPLPIGAQTEAETRRLLDVGNPVGNVLATISRGKTEFAPLAAELLAVADAEGLSVPIVIDEGTSRSNYNGESDTITLSPSGSQKIATVMEEIVHALTVKKIPQHLIVADDATLREFTNDLSQPQAQRDLAEAYLKAKAEISDGGYAMQNIVEFVAGAFTDPAFRAKLKAVPVVKSTLWAKFINAIRQLLSLSTTATNLLEKVTRTGIELAQAGRTEATDITAFARGPYMRESTVQDDINRPGVTSSQAVELLGLASAQRGVFDPNPVAAIQAIMAKMPTPGHPLPRETAIAKRWLKRVKDLLDVSINPQPLASMTDEGAKEAAANMIVGQHDFLAAHDAKISLKVKQVRDVLADLIAQWPKLQANDIRASMLNALADTLLKDGKQYFRNLVATAPPGDVLAAEANAVLARTAAKVGGQLVEPKSVVSILQQIADNPAIQTLNMTPKLIGDQIRRVGGISIPNRADFDLIINGVGSTTPLLHRIANLPAVIESLRALKADATKAFAEIKAFEAWFGSNRTVSPYEFARRYAAYISGAREAETIVRTIAKGYERARGEMIGLMTAQDAIEALVQHPSYQGKVLEATELIGARLLLIDEDAGFFYRVQSPKGGEYRIYLTPTRDYEQQNRRAIASLLQDIDDFAASPNPDPVRLSSFNWLKEFILANWLRADFLAGNANYQQVDFVNRFLGYIRTRQGLVEQDGTRAGRAAANALLAQEALDKRMDAEGTNSETGDFKSHAVLRAGMLSHGLNVKKPAEVTEYIEQVLNPLIASNQDFGGVHLVTGSVIPRSGERVTKQDMEVAWLQIGHENRVRKIVSSKMEGYEEPVSIATTLFGVKAVRKAVATGPMTAARGLARWGMNFGIRWGYATPQQRADIINLWFTDPVEFQRMIRGYVTESNPQFARESAYEKVFRTLTAAIAAGRRPPFEDWAGLVQAVADIRNEPTNLVEGPLRTALAGEMAAHLDRYAEYVIKVRTSHEASPIKGESEISKFLALSLEVDGSFVKERGPMLAWSDFYKYTRLTKSERMAFRANALNAGRARSIDKMKLLLQSMRDLQRVLEADVQAMQGKGFFTTAAQKRDYVKKMAEAGDIRYTLAELDWRIPIMETEIKKTEVAVSKASEDLLPGARDFLRETGRLIIAPILTIPRAVGANYVGGTWYNQMVIDLHTRGAGHAAFTTFAYPFREGAKTAGNIWRALERIPQFKSITRHKPFAMGLIRVLQEWADLNSSLVARLEGMGVKQKFDSRNRFLANLQAGMGLSGRAYTDENKPTGKLWHAIVRPMRLWNDWTTQWWAESWSPRLVDVGANISNAKFTLNHLAWLASYAKRIAESRRGQKLDPNNPLLEIKREELGLDRKQMHFLREYYAPAGSLEYILFDYWKRLQAVPVNKRGEVPPIDTSTPQGEDRMRALMRSFAQRMNFIGETNSPTTAKMSEEWRLLFTFKNYPAATISHLMKVLPRSWNGELPREIVVFMLFALLVIAGGIATWEAGQEATELLTGKSTAQTRLSNALADPVSVDSLRYSLVAASSILPYGGFIVDRMLGGGSSRSPLDLTAMVPQIQFGVDATRAVTEMYQSGDIVGPALNIINRYGGIASGLFNRLPGASGDLAARNTVRSLRAATPYGIEMRQVSGGGYVHRTPTSRFLRQAEVAAFSGDVAGAERAINRAVDLKVKNKGISREKALVEVKSSISARTPEARVFGRKLAETEREQIVSRMSSRQLADYHRGLEAYKTLKSIVGQGSTGRKKKARVMRAPGFAKRRISFRGLAKRKKSRPFDAVLSA